MSDRYKETYPGQQDSAHDAALSRLIWRWWWPAYGLGLLIFLVLTPPFQVPDEPHHFYRAYQIAQGSWFPVFTSDAIGGELPAVFQDMKELLADRIAFHWSRKFRLSNLLRAWDIPASPTNLRFYAFPNTALFTPLVYAPHALAIRLAQGLTDRPLAWFYAGRVAGALTVWLVAALCVHISPPPWRPVFILLFMAPMFMFESIGITADPVTNLAVFVFTALLLRVGYSENAISRGELLGLTAVAACLAFCKTLYVAVVLLLIVLPAKKFESARRRWLWVGSVVFLSALLQGLWIGMFRHVGDAISVIPGRAHPDLQRAFLRENPLAFARVLLRTPHVHAEDLARQGVGVLGWLDVILPYYVPLLFFAAYVFLSFSTPSRPLWVRFWPLPAAAVMIGTTLGIMVLAYLSFTPPRHPVVLGVQGRYLLPWGPLAAVVFRSLIGSRPLKTAPQTRLITAIACGGFCFFIAAVWLFRRYYGA